MAAAAGGTWAAQALERNTLAAGLHASVDRIDDRTVMVQSCSYPEGRLDSVVDTGLLAAAGIVSITDEYSVELRLGSDVLFSRSVGARTDAPGQSTTVTAGGEN